MVNLLQVGDVFTLPIGERVYLPNYEEHTLDSEREYVVEITELTGGGTGHGPYDVYPDGHKVIASALVDGEHINGPLAKRIMFYQTGSFRLMHRDVPVIRRMVRKFVRAE